jgi:hypothetical protein
MRRVYLTVMAALASLVLVAQEKSTDVNINVNKDGGGSFWGSPVMWIIGAAVFIIIIVAVSRSGSRQ